MSRVADQRKSVGGECHLISSAVVTHYFSGRQYKFVIRNIPSIIASCMPYWESFLNAIISDGVREGIVDIFGQGTDMD